MSENTTTTAPKTKAAKPLLPCWCGCGGTTKSRFVPGHDARFHGWAKKVARCELDATDTLKALPHKEARDEMVRHVELEIPKAEARAEAEEKAEAEKAAKKEAATAAKAAAEAAKAEPETAPVVETETVEAMVAA